jgi:hypothetical protein
MNKKKQKVELLKALQERVSSLTYPYNAEEKSIIRRVLSEEEWCLLSDDEKQSRRKASISLGKKWAIDDNIETVDYSYSEGVVVVYDIIRETLNKIDAVEGELDNELLRVKAFFLIEKDFIDEKGTTHMNRHLPRELFDNLATTLGEKYPFLQLDKFCAIYSKMFEKWPNKPKPIN